MARAEVALLLLLLCTARVAAHGRMTLPPSRQGGTLDVAGTKCGWHDAGTAAECECCWFTTDIAIPGNATIPGDSPLVTTSGCHDVKPGGCDWTKTRPWRAPGSAPILSPCGKDQAKPDGADGRDLPPVPAVNRTTWRAGATVDVAFTINANHGGGYSWRLCPSSGPLTEECFQKRPLDFVGATSTQRYTSGKQVTIPALRTSSGTTPAGSMWTKIPIPAEPADSGEWDYSIIDQVVIPADTAPGSWVLSWRWDTETTPQSWANCADVEITAA